MGVLDRIHEFGRIDAESERQLGEFFLRTDAYRRIEDQEHIVVTGRKGTGKTAIYKTLQSRANDYSNVLVAGLEFRNYPWNTHGEVSDSSASPVERYLNSWKFLMLVELAKLVLTNNAHERPQTADAEQAERVLAKFIKTNWGDLDFRFRDIFTRREFSFKFEPKVFGVSLGALELDKVPRNQLAGVLEEANRWLLQCLSYILTPEHWYFILFDDLDLAYDPADPEYSDRLIGLLLAAREIFHWAREEGRQLSLAPVVLIRSDVYESLQFPDKNKVTRNLVEPLLWNEDEEGENSLKSVLTQRIKVILEDGSADWDMIFEDQLMRGTQPKFKHMATRTYLRPRDMIFFGNKCLAAARASGNEQITNQNVAEARPAYSEFLVDELDDEIHPVLGEWKLYLDALRRIHTMRFRRDAFEKVFHELSLTDRLQKTPEDALELLYRFSIIGFTKIGGAGYGGSAVAFRYKNPSMSFDPGASSLTVHPGLKEALELVEAGEDSTRT
jgi:energy-coupling factor transporter ATP-binding protein EcfA2